MTAKFDVEIAGSTDEYPPTALALREECKRSYSEHAMRYLAQAEFNERMIIGDQFITLDGDSGIVDASWATGVPKIQRNLLRNLALTWSARSLEDRPAIRAYPSQPGTDVGAARVSNRLLDFCHQRHDFDDLCFRAAMLVQPHSGVGFKVTWDSLDGPEGEDEPILGEDGAPEVSEDGSPRTYKRRLGDVRWDLCSVFDYGTDGAEDVEDAEWCYFTRYLSLAEARAIYRAAGIDADPGRKQYTTVWGVQREGVEAFELWFRRCARFPQGLFLQIIGDVVVEARSHPYEHGELPLAVWKAGHRRDSPFGSTHVDDAVVLQRQINEAVSAMARQVREVATIKVLLPPDVHQAWSDGNQMIAIADPSIAKECRYLEPPDIAPVLRSSLEDSVQALYTVFGLNEILTGAENIGKNTAAKSIAFLNKLDSMKMSGSARSLGKAILRVMRQTLKLYQQYVDIPRVIQIAGQENMADAVTFSKADIAGVDVRLEASTGIERYAASQAAEAAQANEKAPSLDLGERATTGLTESTGQAAARQMVQEQIRTIMQGGQATPPDPNADPDIAIRELIPFLQAHGQSQLGPQLMQLMQAYQQMAAQRSAQQTQNEAEVPQ